MRSEAARSGYRLSLSGALVVLLSALLLPAVVVSVSEAHGGDPNVVHGCIKTQQGITRIVGAYEPCGPSETAVHWNITGQTGPTGPAGPQGPPGPAGAAFLEVVDSADEPVGSVVGVEFLNPVVAFKAGERVFALKLIDDQLYGYSFPYFQSEDCRGPAYVQRVPGTLPATGVDQSYRVYGDTGQDPVLLPLRSYATPDGCVSVNFSFTVVPATMVLDLGAQFTPPFRVR